MKARISLLIIVVLSITLALSWTYSSSFAKSQQNTLTETQSLQAIPDYMDVLEATDNPILENEQTILIWPKSLPEVLSESPEWELWLDISHETPYVIRDNLLISVQAIAAQLPELTIETDEPNSEIIAVTGNRGYLENMLNRLRNHPLFEKVTDDSVKQREIARESWQTSTQQENNNLITYQQDSPTPIINIRNNFVSNVVWGYIAPNNLIQVTLIRENQSVTTETSANDLGLFFAHLPWEIRSNDVVRIEYDSNVEEILIPALKVSVDRTNSIINAIFPLDIYNGEQRASSLRAMEFVVGNQKTNVEMNEANQFSAKFPTNSFTAGTPAFIRYYVAEDLQVYQPLSVDIVNVRRDTSNSLPVNAHMNGISSIVWGAASPEATLVLTLTRSGQFEIMRTISANQGGGFTVSMDQLIKAGDILQIRDETDIKTIEIPELSFQADPVEKIITGIAPSWIQSLIPSSPHSLQILIPGASRQVTTKNSGFFTADFSSAPYLAGLLGSIRYTTPDGDQIYQPMFIADPPTRGDIDDWRADIILGQPDFSTIIFNQTVGNQVFLPEGVLIDPSVHPNRLYVYDSGNSRVLGFSHLGACIGGVKAGEYCTSDYDCPNSSCQIDAEKGADLVIGQPDFNSTACNGDSVYQMYPDVPMGANDKLCGMREEQMSVSEGGSGATMITDQNGNLYVPDFFNNRVLRYDDPFTTDTVADYVWGQDDFQGIHCNQGVGIIGPTNARSLCLAPPPGIGDLRAGVALDSENNLWVADNENNRVLRFPFDPETGVPAKEADLVLGQPDFTTNNGGSASYRMFKPASIAVHKNGDVYVADSLNNRVLIFTPPFSNGMSYSDIIWQTNMIPTGLAIDSRGDVWVNEEGNHRITRYHNCTLDLIIPGVDSLGGLGFDDDGNLFAVASGGIQEVRRFVAPTYSWDASILVDQENSIFNQVGPRGLWDVSGIEIANGQLIAGDGSRILFWNDPENLTNYQEADGFVGVPNFQYQEKWGQRFRSMRANNQGRLWVTHYEGYNGEAQIYQYELPLETLAEPVYSISSPLPLQGGGEFTWTSRGILLSGIAIQPDCDCLWLSDTDYNRVFRIQNASTNPVVDIVLGQIDINGIHCNHGRDPDNNYARALYPTQDSLCHPGAVAFDNDGNLFVSDHNAEIAGNWRLLAWDASSLPDNPPSAVFGIPASRVFGRNGSFTESDCQPREDDPLCGPFEPAFDSQGHMAIGFNSYIGPRFPVIYKDIYVNPLPIGVLGDLHSWPVAMRFDEYDNLYVVDSNRSRILIYKTGELHPGKK